jgi:hypothetical protein
VQKRADFGLNDRVKQTRWSDGFVQQTK